MAHKATMILDFQYGSTGKGAIAGYLAKRTPYDTVTCAFATNAGHTYIDKSRDLHIMTQQLPTAIVSSPDTKIALIGPGALIHKQTFLNEVKQFAHLLEGKTILIHPHAAVVEDYHANEEKVMGFSKIGSTTKGVGAAMVERILREPGSSNIAAVRWRDDWEMSKYVTNIESYRAMMDSAQSLLIEGAQGFGLSMYHGFYPYTTSRDVTPWQVAADCGLPFKIAPYIQVVGSMRTFPIRVNNRDGHSGPCYPDQHELDWSTFEDQGIAPELTTVTKLKRRIFTFSQQQALEAAWHCGGYWDTKVFLNFANYCRRSEDIKNIIGMIEAPTNPVWNPPKVAWLGYGADDGDIREVV